MPPYQLLSAASLFQLDALQRHCEILCSQTLSVESAVNTYKYAKVSTGDAEATSQSHTTLLALLSGHTMGRAVEGAGVLAATPS